MSPELFDIHTAEEIRNTEGTWKNVDNVLSSGGRLEELDQRMRSVFDVCMASNSVPQNFNAANGRGDH